MTHDERARRRPAWIIMLAVILLIGVSGAAAAGSIYTVDLIGFSEDGRYAAFTTSSILDFSGFEEITLYLLDVPANDYARAPDTTVFGDDEDTSEAIQAERVAMRERHEAALRDFAIIPGNTGVQVFRTRDFQFVEDYPRPKELAFPLQRFAHLTEEVRLTLTEKDVTGHECNQFTDPDNPVIFRMELRRADGSVNVLQDDQVLFASRSCPLEYGFSEVVYYRGYLVIFVNSFTFQLEGPDMRKLAVSGSVW